MFKKISLSVLMMVMVLLITVSTAFGASEKYQGYYDNSGNISITDVTVSDKDLFFAGSNIAVKSVFNSTTFFVGNSVILDGEYNGDVFAVGNTITINGKINGNLYTVGNQVTINGLVDGDVFSAGNNVTISNTATINRDLYIASSSAYMDGNVGRNLRFNAGNANINGTVNGYVESDVKQLIISNNAKVTGAIDNRSANEAIVSANALVPTINWEQVKEQTVEKDQGTSIGSIILSIITKLAFILVIWLLITFLTKDFRENTGIMAKKHILASLGIGAAMLFISPLLIGLSFIIYVPFGIAMTLLIIATCILSMPIAVVVFSKLLGRFFNDKMKPLLSSFVSVLIIAAAVIILEFIPFLGGFVGFFLMLFGLGFMGYNILFTNKKLKEERDLMTELVFTEKINNDVTEEVLAIEEKDENQSVEDSEENK